MSTHTAQSLELLNFRVREIEEQLFGSDELPPPKQSIPNQVNLLRTISEIDQKLKSLTIGKERFNHCYTELRKLDKWISSEASDLFLDDASAMDSTTTSGINSESSKFEEVLAFEDEIRADAEATEKIQTLEPALDKEALREVPQLQPALDQLNLELLQTRKMALDLEDETRAAIDQTWVWFSDIVNKLASLNTDLTELERKKEEAKYD